LWQTKFGHLISSDIERDQFWEQLKGLKNESRRVHYRGNEEASGVLVRSISEPRQQSHKFLMGRLGLLKVSGTYHFYENNAPALRRLNELVDKINGALQAAAYLLNALHTITLLNGPKPFMVYLNESIMSKHGNANKHAH